MKNAYVASSALVCLVAIGAFGCSGSDKEPPLAPDVCAEVDARFELQAVYNFESSESDRGNFWDPWNDGNEGANPVELSDTGVWLPAPDRTYLGATTSLTNEEITDAMNPAPCTGERAMVARASKVDRYGGAFGGAFAPKTEGFDGVGIWARAADHSALTATLLLSDVQTAPPGIDPITMERYCFPMYQDVLTIFRDENGNEVRIPGPDGVPDPLRPGEQAHDFDGDGIFDDVPVEQRCGNFWRVILNVSREWQFYTFPWSAWYQISCIGNADRGCDTVKAEGLLGATFDQIRQDRLITMYYTFTPFVETDIWIDSINLYKAR